jgi:dynein heavy chain
LEELSLGFNGLLTISENMEQLIDSIALDKVPKSWVDLAYPSKRGLASWFQNLLKRIEQLRNWKDDPNVIPKVTMLNRLFNPQSFLTAIKQVVGRRNQWELNKINIQTDVMKKSIEEIDSQPKEGAYVYGFVIEGARWDVATDQLEESRLR